MDNNLVKQLHSVALRYRAVFVDILRKDIPQKASASKDIAAFTMALSDKGYVVEEELLRALCIQPAAVLEDITQVIDTALGTDLNWAPLVKGWNVPTGESYLDHLVTLYANVFKDENLKGTTLPCGHFIPDGTFPLERYNGCPFCGTPFKTADFTFKGQGSKKKSLRLMNMEDMLILRDSLLGSAVPLDATQASSLKTLINVLGINEDACISMKETRMIVADAIAGAYLNGSDSSEAKIAAAGRYLASPADILRFLWYRKTGKLQILKPKTLMAHAGKLNRHMWGPLDKSAEASQVMKQNLKLRYNRRMCHAVAVWINSLQMPADEACQNMHPNRGMWVRMIRALRLGEYSRKPGFDNLRVILDSFYNSNYSVWKGNLDQALGINCGCVDYDKAFELLRQRPGAFARSLFALMLRVGPVRALSEFRSVMDKVPARLILSLGNAADIFFDPQATRIARPITGSTKVIGQNRKLSDFRPQDLLDMASSVKELYKEVLYKHFQKEPGGGKMYIQSSLYDIPVSVGDRSSTVQDTSVALQGTRFKVDGNSVRLFMQWGKGLSARHLDMDLSAAICLKDGSRVDCAYYNLSPEGAKHSGDIRNIPDQTGTAEYIELDLAALSACGAKYVAFSCNAYSNGAISPNLMVGWMNSQNPMTISDETGVAYDPSTVQHIVRVDETNLSKGLVFGVLDIDLREITWLELPFTAQFVGQLDTASVESLLRRLRSKITIGELLQIKAQAQGHTLTPTADLADKDLCYTYTWALDAASVSKLLLFG